MDQLRRQGDLEHGDGNQDRDFTLAGEADATLQGQESEQAQRAQKHPCRRESQRGDELQPHFHDRPVDAPKKDDPCQKNIR